MAAGRIGGTACITIAVFVMILSGLVFAFAMLMIALMILGTMVGNAAPAPGWSSLIPLAGAAAAFVLGLLLTIADSRWRR